MATITLLGIAAALTAAAIWAAVHALLTKNDPRAALGWIGICLLTPGLGPLLYLLFGVNRVQRKARRLRRRAGVAPIPQHGADAERPPGCAAGGLAAFIDQISPWPPWGGNRVEPADGGRLAYDRMVDAIDGAERSVALASYIFDLDETGQRFVDALARARGRGVEVRVLLDAAGTLGSGTDAALSDQGVRVARFNPLLLVRFARHVNLRNHRKILVVDGRVAFTGGMNITHACTREPGETDVVIDLHARLQGPIVGDLLEAFAADWQWATGETTDTGAPPWDTDGAPAGDVSAQIVTGGPDDDMYRLALARLGAIGCAQERITILTPYFLPGPEIVAALTVAALRGVRIDLIVPDTLDHRPIGWAMQPILLPLLRSGCHVWRTTRGFDHTKLMLVDATFALLGSANWDPRSLRLNFELEVACHDAALVTALQSAVDARLAGARAVSADHLEGRRLLVRLRDNAAWLLSPYL